MMLIVQNKSMVTAKFFFNEVLDHQQCQQIRKSKNQKKAAFELAKKRIGAETLNGWYPISLD